MYRLTAKYCKEYKIVAWRNRLYKTYTYMYVCVLTEIRYFIDVVHMIWHCTHLYKEFVKNDYDKYFVKNDYDKLKLMTNFHQTLPENVNYFLEVELRINIFVNNSSSVY